ncbi:dehydrogenase [Dissulfurispira thermophila]|uniref:Dehydrogenase n=1 Tax=Dissulfurispira thermophila TaxID=2715679 RepID=A0A7G1H0S0_9BACT|nr:Gfo/Idh/MocA family oxidoreductase [Dissulfurispira thermophila]BCB96334.1 dehydrogenase [Dissulfurispira thermophila]
MIRIGMIGISEGNGHPYSFSAIFNGYDDESMKQSEWSNIYAYLRAKEKVDFGICGAKVTHIWTQNINESIKIAKATKIENVVEKYEDMIDYVDAVIIARDDWQCHREIASIFLEADKYVFIDKPLSLNMNDVLCFETYLKRAKLMSCSAIRYSPELDIIKRDINEFGKIKLIRGTTIKSWEKYGIHMLEGIFSVCPFTFRNIRRNICSHDSFTIETAEGFVVEIDCLGDKSPLTMRIEFYSDTSYFRADCMDSFVAFKRTLQNFIFMIENSIQPIETNQTVELMRILSEGMKRCGL